MNPWFALILLIVMVAAAVTWVLGMWFEGKDDLRA